MPGTDQGGALLTEQNLARPAKGERKKKSGGDKGATGRVTKNTNQQQEGEIRVKLKTSNKQ